MSEKTSALEGRTCKKKSSELKKAYLKNKRLPNSGNATYLKQWDNGKELISYRSS